MFFTKESDPVHKVTIVPRANSLGHVSSNLYLLFYKNTNYEMICLQSLTKSVSYWNIIGVRRSATIKWSSEGSLKINFFLHHFSKFFDKSNFILKKFNFFQRLSIPNVCDCLRVYLSLFFLFFSPDWLFAFRKLNENEIPLPGQFGRENGRPRGGGAHFRAWQSN